MNSRQITFAGSSLQINYAPRFADVIDILFRHIPAESDQPPHLTYSLTESAPERVQLHREEIQLYEGPSAVKAAELLLGDCCYHLAAQSREGLMFHAAALAWRGQGVMLPGASSAGKTTLTAWLLSRGFTYLTDELVFIPRQSQTLHFLTRPLNSKPTARPILSRFFDFNSHAARYLHSSQADLIPHTLLNPTILTDPIPLRLIVFPTYHTNIDFDLTPLSRAKAALTLMQTLINARNLPNHGFSETTALARQIPAYQLQYNSFAHLEGQIEKLFPI